MQGSVVVQLCSAKRARVASGCELELGLGLEAAHGFALAVTILQVALVANRRRRCNLRALPGPVLRGLLMGLRIEGLLSLETPTYGFKRTAPMLGPSFLSLSGVWHRARRLSRRYASAELVAN